MSSSRLLTRHEPSVRSSKRTSLLIKQKRTIFFLLHNHKRRCHHPLEAPQWTSSQQKDSSGPKEKRKEKEATQTSWPGPADFYQSISDTKIPHFYPWKTMRGWRSDLLAHLPEKEQNAYNAFRKDKDQQSTSKDKPPHTQNDNTRRPHNIFDQYIQQRNLWRQQHDLLHEHLGTWRDTKARLRRGLRNEFLAQKENIGNILKQQMEHQMRWQEPEKPVQPSKPPPCTLDSSPMKTEEDYEIDLITLKRVKKLTAADTVKVTPDSGFKTPEHSKAQIRDIASERPTINPDIAAAVDRSESASVNQTSVAKDLTSNISMNEKRVEKNEPLFVSSFLRIHGSDAKPEITPAKDMPMANEKVFDIYSPKNVFMHKNLQSLMPNEEVAQASKHTETIVNQSQHPAWDTFNNPAKCSIKAEERGQTTSDVSSLRQRLETFKAELDSLYLSRLKEDISKNQTSMKDDKQVDSPQISTTPDDNTPESSISTPSAMNSENTSAKVIEIAPSIAENTSSTKTVEPEAGQVQTAAIGKGPSPTESLQDSLHTSPDGIMSFESHKQANHVPNEALDELITQTLLADKSWSDYVPESTEDLAKDADKQGDSVKHHLPMRDGTAKLSSATKQTTGIIGNDATLKSAVTTTIVSDLLPLRSRHERRRILRSLQKLETQELNDQERTALSNTISIFMETRKQVQSISERTLGVKEEHDAQPISTATTILQDSVSPLKGPTQTTSKSTENTGSSIPSPASLVAGIQYDKKARGTLPDEEAVSAEIIRYLQESKARQEAIAATNILEAAKAEQSKQKAKNQGKWKTTKRVLLTGTYVAACGYVVGVGSKLLFG